MSELELDPILDRIVREARRPVALREGARARLLEAVRAEPRPEAAPRRDWLRPRRMSLAPLTGGLLAAGLVGIGVVVGRFSEADREGRIAASQPVEAAAAHTRQLPSHPDSANVLTFVLVAPQAARVAVVGDFNGWDEKASPMTRTRTGGTWSVTLRLPAGLHLYSFVVDGKNWVVDPSAPLAPDDGFGAPSSVALVGGSSL